MSAQYHYPPWFRGEQWRLLEPFVPRGQGRGYEMLTANSDAMIQISLIHLLLKRLA